MSWTRASNSLKPGQRLYFAGAIQAMTMLRFSLGLSGDCGELSSMFLSRCQALPFLGIGVSTEYGAHADGTGLDPDVLATTHPEYGQFLEIGVEVDKGLDASRAWLSRGRPCTYHFLDVNLDDQSTSCALDS